MMAMAQMAASAAVRKAAVMVGRAFHDPDGRAGGVRKSLGDAGDELADGAGVADAGGGENLKAGAAVRENPIALYVGGNVGEGDRGGSQRQTQVVELHGQVFGQSVVGGEQGGVRCGGQAREVAVEWRAGDRSRRGWGQRRRARS